MANKQRQHDIEQRVNKYCKDKTILVKLDRMLNLHTWTDRNLSSKNYPGSAPT